MATSAILRRRRGRTREREAGVPASVRALVEALTTAPARLAPEERWALLERARALALDGDPPSGVPAGLQAYADQVTFAAHAISDADIEALRAAGFSEDEVLEASWCAAVGAALARLERGLELLNGGDGRAA